jgi:hypothetical protein
MLNLSFVDADPVLTEIQMRENVKIAGWMLAH